MPALGREADMLRCYARLSSRKHDLVLGYPWRQEERVTVKLPAGYAAQAPARGAHRRGAVRSVHDGRDAEGRGGRGRGRRSRSTGIASRARTTRAFRAFCADVDAAIGQELVLGK